MKYLAFVFALTASISFATAAAEAPKLTPFELADQFEQRHAIQFPRTNLLVLTIAGRKTSTQIDSWIKPLKQRCGNTIAFAGLADVSNVPRFLRGKIRARFRESFSYPIMLDWDRSVISSIGDPDEHALILLLHRDGTILHRAHGEASPRGLKELYGLIERSSSQPAN